MSNNQAAPAISLRHFLTIPLALLLIFALVGTALADFNYTIKPGDTLSKIAHSNNTTVAALIASNKTKFPCLATKAACLQVGWVISIPGSSGITATGPSTYSVQSGDSLSKIAKKLGVDFNGLIAANKIARPCLANPTPCALQIGWTLTIPGGLVAVPIGQTPDAVIIEYFAALNARDAARFKATLHPDLLANEPDPDFDIQNFIEILSSVQIKYQILSISVTSQTTTTAEVAFAIRLTSPLANIDGYAASATFTLAKSAGQWRILDENIERVELIP